MHNLLKNTHNKPSLQSKKEFVKLLPWICQQELFLILSASYLFYLLEISMSHQAVLYH